MRKSLLAFCVSSALFAPVLVMLVIAAEASTNSRLQALDARIRALEAEGQKLRDQAAAALAEADAARAELDKMKAVLTAVKGGYLKCRAILTSTEKLIIRVVVFLNTRLSAFDPDRSRAAALWKLRSYS